jgi:predicted nucleotidyltransferase
MRFTRSLDLILSSPTKLQILRVLTRTSHRAWTGRELAGAASVSTSQTARDLLDLLNAGIVSREVHGRTHAWRLAAENALTPEVVRLFGFEANLKSTLAHDVASLLRRLPVRRAVLFGSLARGDDREDSDIDLFVEVPRSRDKPLVETALARVRDRVWDRYGRPLSAILYTSAEVRHPPNQSLLDSIDRDAIEVVSLRGGTSGPD